MPIEILLVILTTGFIFNVVVYFDKDNNIILLSILYTITIGIIFWILPVVFLTNNTIDKVVIEKCFLVKQSSYIQIEDETLINLNKELGRNIPVDSDIEITYWKQYYGGIKYHIPMTMKVLEE